MSRLDVKTPSQAQDVVDQLYRNMERRIAASPPGLCPVDMALNFLNLPGPDLRQMRAVPDWPDTAL